MQMTGIREDANKREPCRGSMRGYVCTKALLPQFTISLKVQKIRLFTAVQQLEPCRNRCGWPQPLDATVIALVLASASLTHLLLFPGSTVIPIASHETASFVTTRRSVEDRLSARRGAQGLAMQRVLKAAACQLV